MKRAAEDFTKRPGIFTPARFCIPVRINKVCRILFLLGALCVSTTSHAADTYGALLDKQFTPNSQAATNAPPPNNSSGASAASTAAFEQALKNRALKVELGPPPPPPPNAPPGLAITIASSASALILLKVFFILSRFHTKREAAAAARDKEKLKRTREEPTVISLFHELKHNLNPPAAQSVPEAHTALYSTEAQTADTAALTKDAAQLFESVPVLFSQLHARFAEINRTSDIAARLKMLHEFSQEIRPSKAAARIPALRSHRLLAIALEGFLRQLSVRPQNLTSWRMRLASETLELLEDLCVPTLTPDLATKPLIRLLVVDDCAVNRRSMVFALKKVFPEPDLAPDGEPALALATKNAYDAIFLDIEMPGMNGFELCEKIRETKLNRNTPIVFVTSHDNAESRAKFMIKGAQDLIGKPYLPTEITLKALQLSLHCRMKFSPAEIAAGRTQHESEVIPKLAELREAV